MANYLYRRDGRYYARLRIPDGLRVAYGGKPDLRSSLDTNDYSQARHRVLETVLGWKRSFIRLQAVLNVRQVATGSALLLGDGLITIGSAARECGIDVD